MAAPHTDPHLVQQLHKNELRPVHPQAQRVTRVYEPETRSAIPHLHIKERLGLNPVLLCKRCDAELVLDYSIGGMKRRIDVFCDEHEECQGNE